MIKLYYNFTFLNEYIATERSNKYKAAKIKKETTNALYYMLLNKPKIETPCGLHFHWLVPNKRRDLDNVAFAQKFAIDSMVKAKIIPNDNLMHITSLYHTFEISDKIGVIIKRSE